MGALVYAAAAAAVRERIHTGTRADWGGKTDEEAEDHDL